MPIDMLREALSLAAQGFRVIPIHTPQPNGSCSCEPRHDGSRCGGSAGKHPRLKSWQQDATADPDRIRTWWRAWPDANVGLVMGGTSRLVAVDIDGPEGRNTLARLEDEHGDLPATLTSRSGRKDGGEHRFFRVPDGLDLHRIKNRAGRAGGPMPKVDIRAEAGQVVAPPSLHVSGNRYAWTDRASAIATLPKWLFDLATWEPAVATAPPPRVEPLVTERARSYLMRIPPAIAGQGGHRQTLLAAEHMVRGFELDDGTALWLLSEWNRTCEPPWSERELQHKIREARTAGTAVSWGAHTRQEQPYRPIVRAPRVAKVPPQGDGAGLGLLGMLLDMPNLFDRPEIVEQLSVAEGDLALAIAAARSDEVSVVVDRTPASLRDFVSSRLAHPQCDNFEEAAALFAHYHRALTRARRARKSA